MIRNIVNSPDGFRWYAESDDGHLALGGHETELGPILKSFGAASKEYLNIGAHVGTWSIRLAQYFKHVWAIEANPKTLVKLMDNVYLNKLESKVTGVGRAFWDTDQQIVTLVDANGRQTGGSTRALTEEQTQHFSTHHLQAQTSTVDSYFNYANSPKFGLITIDVEGAEARVLRGAVRTLEKDRPHVVVELHEGHPGVDEDLNEQVYSVLREANYSVSVLPVGVETMLICTPAELFIEEVLPTPVLHDEPEDDIMALRTLIGR